MNELIYSGISMNTRTRSNANLMALTAFLLGAGLAGCGSSGSDSTSVTVSGDVPIAYVKRANTIEMNPTDGTSSGEGGDLIKIGRAHV